MEQTLVTVPSDLETAIAKPNPWTAFWRSAFRLQTDKVNPWIALRNTVGLTLPLAIAAAMGQVPAGLALSTGALNVSFRDSAGPYAQRARLMTLASVIAGLGVFAGGMSGRNSVTAILVAGVWAFGAGMLVVFGTAAADLGVLSVVMLVIYSASAQAARHPVYAGLLALGGGLGQTLLALAFWPIQPHVPERRALSALYMALSRAAAQPVQVSQAPPASAESTAARAALAELDRDDSTEGIRCRALMSQAERLRLSLITLSRIRNRMHRENPAGPEVRILDRYFEPCANALRWIGASLLEDGAGAPDVLAPLEHLAEELRSVNGKSDSLFPMEALEGQLRSAADLATHATAAGAKAFAEGEAAKPWKLRFQGRLATLRANLNLDSAAFRHAVRLAVCVALGDALARGFDLQRSYWLPMTIAIVLKPDFTATFSRGVLRLLGTFAGLVFATLLFDALPSGVAAQMAAVAILMFVVRCFGSTNYGLFTSAITALVVLLIAMSGVSPREVIAARAWNTVGGGAIALLAYWLWPTWERTQFSESMARLLDAYRNYFRAIRESYLRPEAPAALDQTRVAARLARTNVEASVDRLQSEPGTSTERVDLSNSMVATSFRLAHALMSLEAGIYSGRTGHAPDAPDAFRPFADHVELTFYHLAAALRGSLLRPDSLPDLREDHYKLVHSDGASDPSNALVNVEADRITNALNTLKEELLQWESGGTL